jgi:CubicO group peptidase (beta-lactamase class C family)
MRRRLTRIGRAVLLSGVLSVACLAGCDRPATASPDLQALSAYLKQRADAGQFSGTVVVAEDGRPVLTVAHGMADRPRQVANTAATRYDIASMGKMFTSVAIAQLVEQGKLSFTDTIGRYVSGFRPEIADTVTIHQLLTHTSGMGDEALARRPDRPTPPSTLAGQLAAIVKAPLRFQPGSQHSYSNDGFIVLGAIIERVTGQSYADYVSEHVFKPAGMTDTVVALYKPTDVPNMAHPSAPASGLRDDGDAERVGNPSGGGYSTAADMIAFATALTGNKLLSPALTETVMTGKVATNRRPGDKYAYGFADFTVNGVRIVGHNGGAPGYEGQLDIYPTKGYAVIILTNQDEVAKPAIAKSQEILTR